MSDADAALVGKIALVTGAGGGIGGAIAEALGARGAIVGLVGRRSDALQSVAQRIRTGEGHALVADLTDDTQVRTLAQSFVADVGPLDVLVHSNGIHLSGLLGDASVEDFDRQWAANVRAPLLLTQALLPSIRASKGQIVFVNSSITLRARPGAGQFAATQHALRAVADTLREEVNDEGVRVLSVYPGRTATRRQEEIFRREGRPYRPEQLLQATEIATVVVGALGLPRTAEITDVHIRPMFKPA